MMRPLQTTTRASTFTPLFGWATPLAFGTCVLSTERVTARSGQQRTHIQFSDQRAAFPLRSATLLLRCRRAMALSHATYLTRFCQPDQHGAFLVSSGTWRTSKKAALSGRAACRRNAGLGSKSLSSETRCLSLRRCLASTFWRISQRP